jgi:rod shape-determining protein MreD
MDFSPKTIKNLLRFCVPYGLLGLMFCLNALTLPKISSPTITLFDINLASGSTTPLFFIMGLYYWSIYRPTLIPPIFCVITGLVMDSLIGMPLGLNAVLYTLVQTSISKQRRYLMGQTFIISWLVFGFVSFSCGFFYWFLPGLAGLNWIPDSGIFFQSLLSFFLYPFVMLILIYTHKIMPTTISKKF